MPLVYLTRRERFNAAHRLYNPHWSEEKNQEIFGKCANKNWHGHNYEIFVTVAGEPDAQTGCVLDLKDLSTLIKDKVIEPLDHKNLNLDVPFMQDKMASTENLCIEVWKLLEPEIAQLNSRLHSIRIHETENNYVEYRGE